MPREAHRAGGRAARDSGWLPSRCTTRDRAVRSTTLPATGARSWLAGSGCRSMPTSLGGGAGGLVGSSHGGRAHRPHRHPAALRDTRVRRERRPDHPEQPASSGRGRHLRRPDRLGVRPGLGGRARRGGAGTGRPGGVREGPQLPRRLRRALREPDRRWTVRPGRPHVRDLDQRTRRQPRHDVAWRATRLRCRTVGGGGRAGRRGANATGQPGRRDGLSRRPRRHGDLPRRGCRPRGGVRRHDNGPDGGQPDEPHVLQPGRRRVRRGPCGPDRGRRDPADRRAVDPHR